LVLARDVKEALEQFNGAYESDASTTRKGTNNEASAPGQKSWKVPKNPAENFNSAPVKEVGIKTTGVSKIMGNSKVSSKETSLKVILLGAAGCGKSSLVVKFCDGKFKENSLEPTVGVNHRF
jgi:predicted AAA+ superfamily ATPase